MCQFGEHNICASAFSSRAFGDPECSWQRSAHGFCSNFHLPFQSVSIPMMGMHIKLPQHVDVHIRVQVMGQQEKDPALPHVLGGAQSRAVQPHCSRFAATPSLGTMHTAGQWGSQEPEAAWQMVRGLKEIKRVSLSLTALNTIGLQSPKLSPVALEASLALISSFLPSTSQTGSKVIAFSPVELMLLYVRANQRRICPARSALVKLSSRVNLLFGLWDR